MKRCIPSSIISPLMQEFHFLGTAAALFAQFDALPLHASTPENWFGANTKIHTVSMSIFSFKHDQPSQVRFTHPEYCNSTPCTTHCVTLKVSIPKGFLDEQRRVTRMRSIYSIWHDRPRRDSASGALQQHLPHVPMRRNASKHVKILALRRTSSVHIEANSPCQEALP